jgi:hypothetical protein
MNARRKGAAGERLWRDQLNQAGFTGSARASYGQAGGDAYNHPDVFCPALPKAHWEVKNTQSLNVRKAMGQAVRDSQGKKIPLVSWKKNHEGWLVTMNAEDFFGLVQSGSAYLQ